VSSKDPPKKEKRRREKTEEKRERESEDSGCLFVRVFLGSYLGWGLVIIHKRV